MERDDIVYYCGKEEHEHTDECYESQDEPQCGLEETEAVEGHTHTDECYEVETVLTCDQDHEHTDECYEEQKKLVCQKEEKEAVEGHTHSEKCFWTTELVCGKEAHTHTRQCESNKDDKETKEEWEHSIPAKLEEKTADRVVQIAKSQKDYKEVKDNFEIDEDGAEHYYTRYGDWYGKPYEDWNVMFTSFVLKYAGIKNEQIPYGHDWNEWIKDLTEKKLFASEDYEPKNGDLIFIKDQKDENIPDKEIKNYVGIITDLEYKKVIVGDLNGQVKEITLDEKDYETNAYVEIKNETEEQKPVEDDETNNEEEEQKPVDEEEEQPKDDENKEEKEDKPVIDYQLPEQFDIETEDFTLVLKPRVFDDEKEEEQPKEEEETSEPAEEDEEQGLHIKQYSLLEQENVQDKIDEENELSKEELDQIAQDNEKQQEEQREKPVPTVKLEKIEEQTTEEDQEEIEQLKEQVDEENLLDLSFYKLRFFVDDQEIDLGDQKFDAELTPTKKLAQKYDVSNQYPDAAPEAEMGVELKVTQADMNADTDEENQSLINLLDTNIEKKDHVLLNPAKEPEKISLVIDSSRSMRVLLTESDNPEFEVEIYGRLVKNREAVYEDFYNQNGSPKAQIDWQKDDFQVIDMTTIPAAFADNGQLKFKDYKKIGNQIETYTDEPEQIYSSSTYQYHKAPNLKYFNKLEGINSYILKEIWVKKPNNNKEEWFKFIYDNENDSNNIRFTNYAEHENLFDLNSNVESTALQAEGRYILITSETIIRLVFDETKAKVTENTSFWDYDFFEIENGQYYIRKGDEIVGINNTNNYTVDQSNQGEQYNANSKLVFGNGTIAGHFYPQDLTQNVNKNNRPINQSAGVNPDKTTTVKTTQDIKDSSGNIRKNVSITRTVKSNPIFGLVGNSLTSNGYLKYNVNSPKLFRDGGSEVKGKSSELGGNLMFERSGDTYRLYGVNGPNNEMIADLNIFTTQKAWNSEVQFHRNNFWPLDKYDVSKNYGSVRKDLKDTKNNSAVESELSDNGVDHNTAFGMRYEVQFKLDENYTGPLRYFFFGDDDMWVYLDGQLICDLGGVHQTIGAEVNIRDVLNRRGGSIDGLHTLVVYFLERGQSGSTCYIEYTLPNVVSVIPENTTGEIKLEKQSNDIDPEKEYRFEVELTKPDGSPLEHEYSLSVFDKNDNSEDTLHSNVTINSKGDFLLSNSQYVKIEHLPAGTKYKFTEVLSEEEQQNTIVSSCFATGTDNCTITEAGVSPPIVITGQLPLSFPSAEEIQNNPALKYQRSHYIKVYNNKTYQLPETGSPGIDPPLIAGGASVMTTSFYALALQRKGRWKKRKK